MADKKKMGRPGTGLKLTSVKLDAEIMDQAGVVARELGVHRAELLSDLLREPIARQYREVVTAMNARLQAGPKAPKP